jgi:hypothetical protein
MYLIYRLKETIHKAFSHKNDGSKFVVLSYNFTYFSNKIQKGKTKRGTIRTQWYAGDLLKQCSSKGDKYVID